MVGRHGPDGTQAERSTRFRWLPDGGFVTRRLGRVFSPRFLLVALVVLGVGVMLGRILVPIPGGVGGVAGVFAGAFLLGLRGGRRRYLEIGAAGAGIAGVTALLEFFVLSVLAGIGLPLVAIGTGVGALAGILGLYFGRDLRDGLTRSL